jgi:hypothetical protein
MSGDHLEDYIIFLTLTVICSWVVQLVVEEFLFSQKHNLFDEGIIITKGVLSEGMAWSCAFLLTNGIYLS